MGDARFGRYRLERMLGKGGMGQVWLARDPAGARVALKLLPAESAADPGYRIRFEREAELATALRDPHLVPIHRHGEVDGRLFIEMDYIEGTDLAAHLATHGPLAARPAVVIAGQVASALDAAHAAGLVHRDVKPSNILVRPDGFAYLIDFGIARGAGQTSVTATGMAIGTWAYMAPERFSGASDARTDIYSLACVLYECVTGRRPYGDTDPAQQMRGHILAEPPRPSVVDPAIPAALDHVIARGMAKEPGDRHDTAGEFARAARAAVGLLPKDAERQCIPKQTAVLPDGPNPTAVLSPEPVAQSNPGDVVPSVDAPNGAGASRVSDAPVGHAPSGGRPSDSAPSHEGSRRPMSASGDAESPAVRAVPAPPVAVGPTPTKVMTEPGPQPTRVETRLYPPVPVRPRPPVPVAYRPNLPVRPPIPTPPGRRWYARRPAPVPVRPAPRRGKWIAPRPAPPPPRRRKRGGVVSKVVGALVVIFLAPFVFAAGCFALIAAGTSGGSQETTVARPPVVTEENPGPAPENGTPAPAGTPVRDGKFEFAVTGVESGVSRVGLQSPRGSYVIVSLDVRNISDETKWFLPFGQKLVDSADRVIDHDTAATAWQTVSHGHGYSFELQPGQSAATQLVFDIPSDAAPAHLELHDFMWSNGVSVAL